MADSNCFFFLGQFTPVCITTQNLTDKNNCCCVYFAINYQRSSKWFYLEVLKINTFIPRTSLHGTWLKKLDRKATLNEPKRMKMAQHVWLTAIYNSLDIWSLSGSGLKYECKCSKEMGNIHYDQVKLTTSSPLPWQLKHQTYGTPGFSLLLNFSWSLSLSLCQIYTRGKLHIHSFNH